MAESREVCRPAQVQSGNQQLPQLPAPAGTIMDRITPLASALAKAGTLKLSADELTALRKAYPADKVRQRDGPRGKKLDYIDHIEISRRLLDVLGSEWACVRLREWYDKELHLAYGAYCLIVRGVWIADTVASWPYHGSAGGLAPDDALEATRGPALRRMAAKALGIGDQCWGDDEPPPSPEPAKTDSQGSTVPPNYIEIVTKRGKTVQVGRAQFDNAVKLLEDAATKGTALLAAVFQGLGATMKAALEEKKDALKDIAATYDPREPEPDPSG